MTAQTETGLTTLESAVLDILREETEEYRESYGSAAKFYQDVIEYGCVSGCVTSLHWYYQTNEFFETHKDEIKKLVSEWKDRHGYSFADLPEWNQADPFCEDIYNRNLIVWRIFENITVDFYYRGIY
jgi:hypothetical protein